MFNEGMGTGMYGLGSVAIARPQRWMQWGQSVDVTRLVAFRPSQRVSHGLSIVVSVLVLALVTYQLRDLRLSVLMSLLSAGGLFWLAFGANYLHAPIAEVVIFRRLWGREAGLFGALFRKQILNSIVLPYAGDAVLLNWASNRGIGAFGAIKDAAILSAFAGSVATLMLVLPVSPSLSAALGLEPATLFASIALLSIVPAAALARPDALFSLATRDLVFVGAVHCARVFTNVGLIALTWHLLLPTEPLNSWLMLAAARMVVTRLPMLPNKELALAAVAVGMFPHNTEVAGVIAATSIVMTVVHGLFWALSATTGRSVPGVSGK